MSPGENAVQRWNDPNLPHDDASHVPDQHNEHVPPAPGTEDLHPLPVLPDESASENSGA